MKPSVSDDSDPADVAAGATAGGAAERDVLRGGAASLRRLSLLPSAYAGAGADALSEPLSESLGGLRAHGAPLVAAAAAVVAVAERRAVRRVRWFDMWAFLQLRG